MNGPLFFNNLRKNQYVDTDEVAMVVNGVSNIYNSNYIIAAQDIA